MAGPAVGRRSLLAGSAALAAVLSAGPAWSVVAGGVAPSDFTLTTPDGRAVAITDWKPQGKPRGIILFSHGADSAPKYYDLIVQPWIDAGWRVLAPLHVDSREHPHTTDYPGLASWKARIEDMRLLVAYIGKAPFVAAGHSYGGVVALMMGGAQPVAPDGISLPFVRRLADAVIAFSPPAPIPVLVTKEGYGTLAVPALIETGTKDILPGLQVEDDGWEGHLAAFDAAAPGGHRYGLLLEGANHYFGGAICDYKQPGPRTGPAGGRRRYVRRLRKDRSAA
ncbi:alpha/beta hydrolase [Novosphingobium album (ex Hu et al. 2023)]|uniref:Alpha/beta fold hydrolase n=1 Tax=Novosphingobium album (ex Hu et al. 2023) TaxID=2930093 RepID=A0ABT0B4M6_9SPHN|nr:alpha/beta fold hydrolase [Novosphingobium album (ex Hu et al. 2023)]MCJ2179774.1 alpha/beta fold hydrolase [Novosphingobium album (ex Hu et al. 2023)]